MDAAFLDALLYRWFPNAAFGRLEFIRCDFTGEPRPVRNPPGQTLVNKLHVYLSHPDLTYYIGVFAKSARIRELHMTGANETFVDWLPYAHHESLRVLELRDIVFNDTSTAALANFLQRARGLIVVNFASASTVLPDAIAAAIGAHPRERISFCDNMRISAAGLDAMFSRQTALIELAIPFTDQSQRSFETMIAVVRRNPLLVSFLLFKKRDDPPIQIPPALAQALLEHPRVADVSLGVLAAVPGLPAHLENNRRYASLLRSTSVDTAPLRLVPVLVTGALRDVVYAQLLAPRSCAEQVARAIVQANPCHGALLRALFTPLRIAELLGDELRVALDAPPSEDAEVVAYTASALPLNGFPGGIHVFAPRARDRAAFEEMAMTTTSFFEHNVLVSDERHSAAMAGLHARQRGASYTTLENVCAEIVAQHAQVPRAPAPLRDQLCLLAVVRAPKHVLSAAEVAEICAEFGGARLPPNPYTYTLLGGGVIARMPAVLEALRKTFALPALLARIVNRAGRSANWFRDGVLPADAIVDVFRHVVESDDVPAAEAARILTTFDVIFPVDRSRAVFPKFRGVPPAMYRALAFLLSRNTTVLSQDDTGAIAFAITEGQFRGERMTARYANGSIAVAAENPAAAYRAARMAYAINQAVDL